MLLERRPDLVVVAGDVNSTLAGALAAVKLHIPVAHLEAGLRSFDRRCPRSTTGSSPTTSASVLLVHSESALDNLEREGIDLARVALRRQHDDRLGARARRGARAPREPWEELGLERGELRPRDAAPAGARRRPEPAARPRSRRSRTSRATHPLVFPVHPRTRGQPRSSSGYEATLVDARRRCSRPPLGYLDFLGLQAEARFVLTDSGGVQEETSALGDPLLHAARHDRAPGHGRARDEHRARRRPARDRADPGAARGRRASAQEIPLWDGAAGPRAAEVLRRRARLTPRLGGRRARGPRRRAGAALRPARRQRHRLRRGRLPHERRRARARPAARRGRLRAAAAGLLPAPAPDLARGRRLRARLPHRHGRRRDR